MKWLKDELRIWRNLIRNRLHVSNSVEKNIISNFHRLYYSKEMVVGTWYNTYYRGVQTLKCPLDLWVYQEIIYKNRPDIIIETGTFMGGSALYMADICEAVGNGLVISIDKEIHTRPKHPRIKYLAGYSTKVPLIDIPTDSKIMVILDSDHSKENVLAELRRFSGMVSSGQYLIVEDTNINGHPVLDDFGDGPMEAVKEFVASNKDFSIDGSMEKFLLTFNPSGFLLRK